MLRIFKKWELFSGSLVIVISMLFVSDGASGTVPDESSEALIRINYQQVDSELMPTDEKENQSQRIASLNFNTLNVIGMFCFLSHEFSV